LAAPQKSKKPPKKPPVTKADPVAGKKVYVGNGCAGCHKIKEDGGEAGPALTAYASDKKKDAAWTTVQIRTPAAHNKEAKMPAYRPEKISDKDMKNLVAYLLTLKG
jgi:mono/diheme cytochrome c family protein